MNSLPSSPILGVQSPSFRFLDLPAELRLKIYRLLLLVDHVIDLSPDNVRHLAPRLVLLQTCRQVHQEAFPIFYGGHTFRLYPLHGRFFHTRYPLIRRIGRRYRSVIKTLELRLGPGWTSPPKSWAVRPRLGLKDLSSLLVLKVFVECDPSHEAFRGFRVSSDFYTTFSGELLRNLIKAAPSLEEIRFDAYPSVTIYSPLVRRLMTEARTAKKLVVWDQQFDEHDETMIGS